MNEYWREQVHNYVRARNHMYANGRMDLMSAIVKDNDYLNAETVRFKQIQQQRANRQSEYMENETRLRVIKMAEQQGNLWVELILKTRSDYFQQGRTQHEERMEHEQLLLSEQHGNWQIHRVIPDRREKVLGKPSHGEQRMKDKPKESLPYINRQIVKASPHLKRLIRYDRNQVQQYADLWWDHDNPAYIGFEVDCTNYVSQCVRAGGAPMRGFGDRASGWWYRHVNDGWSFSWSVSNALRHYLQSSGEGLRAEQVSSPEQLQVGDVIVYDWEGDSRFTHSTIVTAQDAAGMPLVNAHTVSSKHRYWDYRDSYAWTPQTQYRFFHIADEF